MSSTRLGHQITEDTDYLLGAWPLLVELGVPSTSGRARILPPRHHLSERARERAALEAREDRAEARKPGYAAPGKHAVPVNVPLLDLLAVFVATASDVAETVTQCAGVERPPSPSSAWTDPRPYLVRARTWLEPACDADDRVRPWVAEQLHGLADSIAAHLGEVHDGQVLEALCPWCLGRSERRPTGGDLTLVVHDRMSRAEQEAGAADPERGTTLIVCRGMNCTPPDSDVGAWEGPQDGPRRPAWPVREWDWLAQRLLPVDESAIA
ncbi:hypothetical protein ACTHAM_002367 [Cellulomonas soli]|uniref:hypothetical protein n=1 Tax=Cellulomonas soli TaxID=931535 RepID=UPI003F831D1A